MKVFISWAGHETKPFAEFMHEWLQLVIQSVRPWMSERDVAKGSRSMAELGKELEGTQFGLIVLTGANQHSPWINFEAGAISKSVGEASVVPLLLDLKKSDVVGPLGQFQAVDASDRADVRMLLEAMNTRLAEPLLGARLEHVLQREWPSFEEQLQKFLHTNRAEDAAPVRTDREVLDEILLAVRGLRRDVPRPRSVLPKWFQPHYVELLDHLPPVMRSVVVLSALEGLSHDEIAATLGLTSVSVARRLRDARQRLTDLELRKSEEDEGK